MRKITDMLVLYVLCAVLESACGITNHVVVSLLLLFIEVCAVIYLQSMAGRTFAVTVYLLSFLVIKETSYGFPVVLYAVWEQVMEAWEKKEIKRTAVAGITVFLWGVFGVAASRYILSGTDRIQWQILWIVFDMLAVYLRQMTWQDRELQKEFIRIQDDDREYNRMLKLKNRYLIEKQDAQVYSATLKERNRIAREIHDNVGHLLSRALIQTGAVIAVSRDEQTKPLLLSIKETLDCAMNNIRNSVHDLHDESVDLEQTVREMTEKAEGYTVSYEYDMSQDLPRELKYCIISIVKEALSNVTRHSDADRVKLLLREHPAFYQILIQDNGKCVHPGDGTGIGITNMRQRVETFGGTIDIRTENGYRIFIHIPKADIPAGR